LTKYLTVDNVLKTLLAIAVGILLYNVFFKKTEGYYNYQNVDKVSDHAYPMDYEEDDYVDDDEDDVEEDLEDEDVVEEVYDTSDDVHEVDREDDEVVLDDSVDEEMYEYEETEEPYDDSADAEDDETNGEIPDKIYEEADEEAAETGDDVTPYNAYEFLYASDVEDGMQENFVLYENDVGVDTTYN
jgi:hypothetical protein